MQAGGSECAAHVLDVDEHPAGAVRGRGACLLVAGCTTPPATAPVRSTHFNVRDHGAKGDGLADDTIIFLFDELPAMLDRIIAKKGDEAARDFLASVRCCCSFSKWARSASSR